MTSPFGPLDLEELVVAYLGELGLPHQPLPADPDWLLVGLPGDVAAVMQILPTSEGRSVLDIRCPLRTDVSDSDELLQPLAEWGSELLFGRFCYVQERRELTLEHELLGDFLDLPEFGAVLQAISAGAARWGDILADRLGGVPAPPFSALAAGNVVPPDGLDVEPLPGDPRQRRAHLRELLAEKGIASTIDEDDGSLWITSADGVRINLDLTGDGRFVLLLTLLLYDVDVDAPTPSELTRVNGRLLFGRFVVFREPRVVALQHVLVAATLDPPELFASLDSFTSAAVGWGNFLEIIIIDGRPSLDTEQLAPSEAEEQWHETDWSEPDVGSGGTDGYSMSGWRLDPGDRVGGYESTGLLGSGAFGTVFRARDPRLPREVALKVLHPAYHHDVDGLERFRREAAMAARWAHPNLVSVFSAGEDGLNIFIAYELIDGGSLNDLLRREGALAPIRATRLIEQTAAALAHLHDHGTIHRDVKPSNVLLRHPGRPNESAHLGDLGIAFDPARTRLTASGAPGTTEYMAPESLDGLTAAPGDQWSLAVTAVELLTGRHPFRRATQRETIKAIYFEEPDLADIPVGLADVLRRALHRDPDERYPSVADFGAELVAAARQPAAQVPPGRNAAGGLLQLPLYRVWPVRALPDPLAGTPDEIAAGLAEIIEAEGPMFAERAFRQYLAGGERAKLTAPVERRLVRVLRRMVDRAQIEVADEWNERRARHRVVRMVGAPDVWLRERGPRRLEDVPPREIAALARRLRDENGRDLEGTDLARAVLAAYGWQRMTSSLVAWVEEALDRHLH